MIEHIEFRHAERRGDLVLLHLHADAFADDLATLLDRLHGAHVQPDGGVELECVAATGGLGVAEQMPIFIRTVGEDQAVLLRSRRPSACAVQIDA